jgi:hypothetical protein
MKKDHRENIRARQVRALPLATNRALFALDVIRPSSRRRSDLNNQVDALRRLVAVDVPDMLQTIDAWATIVNVAAWLDRREWPAHVECGAECPHLKLHEALHPEGRNHATGSAYSGGGAALADRVVRS